MIDTLNQDTICAISTPQGMGGIAIVRVSGIKAFDIVQSRWQGKPLSQCDSHTAHLGRIVNSRGNLLDEVVVTLFRAPRSFTGEDIVEIACHGSVWIQQQLVATLIDAGCRAATGGEFTRRAFANGRLDLSQAEAVADVIAAQSEASHRLAMNQMRGSFSRQLNDLRERLLHFVSLMELELDFSEEDVTFADRASIIGLAQEILDVIGQLASSYQAGNVIKNGLPVAIIGQTNAGKSTLLNALLHDDRALVSNIQGTTRDIIEDTITIAGTLFRFIDTAGLRDTSDTIERMGIERSWSSIERARIVLWVIDPTAPTAEIEQLAAQIVPRCEGKQLIAVVNKADIDTHNNPQPILDATLPHNARTIHISALNGHDISALEQLIVDTAALPTVGQNTIIVTNARHYQALTRAHTALDRALQSLHSGTPGDLISQDIRETIHHLGEITGEITTQDILTTIFTHFCIGK